jgi:hypothetical protein
VPFDNKLFTVSPLRSSLGNDPKVFSKLCLLNLNNSSKYLCALIAQPCSCKVELSRTADTSVGSQSTAVSQKTAAEMGDNDSWISPLRRTIKSDVKQIMISSSQFLISIPIG